MVKVFTSWTQDPESIITLNEEEVSSYITIGNARHNISRSKGRLDKYGLEKENREVVEELGILGEGAFHKLTSLPWNSYSETTLPDTDIGGYQIKTRSKEWHNLLIQVDRNPQDIFILVTQMTKYTYLIKGWCYGCEGMQSKYIKKLISGRNYLYCVPHEVLHTIKTLPDLRD